MGQCTSLSRIRRFKPSMNNQTSKTDKLRTPNSTPQRGSLTDNLSVGDIWISPKTNSREIGFLELFDDEVKVLSGLADLESKFLKDEPVSFNKDDDLICLLRQESEGKSILTKEEGEWERKDIRESTDRESMTSIDELMVVTGLLFRHQGHGSTGTTNNNGRVEDKALEISTDSGLVEETGTSVASTSKKGVPEISENKIKIETPENVLEFSEILGRKALLQGFLDDVGKYGGVNDENEHHAHSKSSPASMATSSSLLRNKTSHYLFGTARLREDFNLRSAPPRTSQYGSSLFPCYPVHYNLWAPADDDLGKYFNNRQDRRILSICRLSHCHIQLLSPVRKNANGISVQQISIQAPSLWALKRCCSMLDDVFPLFNASNPLKAPMSEDESPKILKSVNNDEGIEPSTPSTIGSYTESNVNEEKTAKVTPGFNYSTSC